MGRRAFWGTMVVAAALLLPGVVDASRDARVSGWVTYSDPTWHISVSIPTSWHIVPPTIGGVRALASQLEAKHQARLAAVYANLISTPAAQKQLLVYHFQAFAYVPSATQQPDFALAFARTTASLAADPAKIADSYAASSARTPGTTITAHSVVSLPAGPAAFVEETQRDSSGHVADVEVYIIGHGTLLWSLSFRSDVGQTGAKSAFSGIARRFKIG